MVFDALSKAFSSFKILRQTAPPLPLPSMQGKAVGKRGISMKASQGKHRRSFALLYLTSEGALNRGKRGGEGKPTLAIWCLRQNRTDALRDLSSLRRALASGEVLEGGP